MPLDMSSQSEFASERQVRRKHRWIRIIGTLFAFVVVGLIPVLFPRLEFADSFLKITLGAVAASAVLAGAWGILVHGDLKQRSDYVVALTITLVMFALAGIANRLYGADWVWAETCASVAGAYPDECSDPATSFRYRHNAANLDQIYGVLAVGQLIPMLSIFKDAVYCWLRPTPWLEIRKDTPDAASIRRANLRLDRMQGS